MGRWKEQMKRDGCCLSVQQQDDSSKTGQNGIKFDRVKKAEQEKKIAFKNGLDSGKGSKGKSSENNCPSTSLWKK